MKWFVFFGYFLILIASAIQLFDIHETGLKEGTIISINCGEFSDSPKGVMIQVESYKLRLRQDCSVFQLSHFEGEKIPVLVNLKKGYAYLPTKKHSILPFIFLLTLLPLVLIYIFNRKK